MLNKAPIRLAVFISAGGSNLQAIIDAIASSQLNAEILVVVSDQANAYGLERATRANIDTQLVPLKPKESRIQYDGRLVDILKAYNIELIVLAGFMRILGEQFVNRYAGKIINLHPSLLPAYKGLNTHARVIKAKEKFHGASVHFVTAGLDEGPIIVQQKTAINPADTPESLQQRIHAIEHQILPSAIGLIADGHVQWADYGNHLTK